jgi:hypothetical protein
MHCHIPSPVRHEVDDSLFPDADVVMREGPDETQVMMKEESLRVNILKYNHDNQCLPTRHSSISEFKQILANYAAHYGRWEARVAKVERETQILLEAHRTVEELVRSRSTSQPPPSPPPTPPEEDEETQVLLEADHNVEELVPSRSGPQPPPSQPQTPPEEDKEPPLRLPLDSFARRVLAVKPIRVTTEAAKTVFDHCQNDIELWKIREADAIKEGKKHSDDTRKLGEKLGLTFGPLNQIMIDPNVDVDMTDSTGETSDQMVVT